MSAERNARTVGSQRSGVRFGTARCTSNKRRVECYRILANWTGGVPDDDNEEPEEETLLKKRKVEDTLSK